MLLNENYICFSKFEILYEHKDWKGFENIYEHPKIIIKN